MRRTDRTYEAAGFEELEPRLFLDGDVTVTLAGHTLKITGDGLDNVIAVNNVDPDEFEVVGLDGTAVNGGGSLTQGDAWKGVKIDLKGGNNRVYFNGVEVNGNVSIKTGSGDDFVDVDPGLLRGNLTIDTGSGYDRVDVESDEEDATIEGNLSIKSSSKAGPGLLGARAGEEITLDGGSQETEINVYEVLVLGKLDIKGGAGHDGVYVDDCTIIGVTHINTCGEDDYVELGSELESGNVFVAAVFVNMGNGSYEGDELAINHSAFGSPVDIKMGKGVLMDDKGPGGGYVGNNVNIMDSAFNSSFTLKTGGGDDDIEIRFDGGRTFMTDQLGNAFGGLVNIDTGGGDDEFGVYGDEVEGDIYINGDVKLDMGSGDDDLYADYVTAKAGVVDGGKGYDRGAASNIISDDPLWVIRNFEEEIAP